MAGQGPVVEDEEHGTHLTIDRAHVIHDDKTNYYAQKGRHSRKGINLTIMEQEYHQYSGGNQGDVRITTYPYRPPVGAMSLNDAPFVIKSDDELPAAVRLRYAMYCKNRGLGQPEKPTCRDRSRCAIA